MEAMWTSRLRWRMRGAWMWPAFAGLTVLDALLIHWRPLAGEGTGLWPALLLASFFNLLVVAVLAPLAGLVVRRRRPDLPRVVAVDYAGTCLMIAVTLALVVAGALHHRAVGHRQAAFPQSRAASWSARRSPPALRVDPDRETNQSLAGHRFPPVGR